MKQQLDKLISEFNQQKTDINRFDFLLLHKGIFTLVLDNDLTSMMVSDGVCKSLGIALYSEEWYKLNDTIKGEFRSYLGWSDGVCSLLTAIGVDHECV